MTLIKCSDLASSDGWWYKKIMPVVYSGIWLADSICGGGGRGAYIKVVWGLFVELIRIQGLHGLWILHIHGLHGSYAFLDICLITLCKVFPFFSSHDSDDWCLLLLGLFKQQETGKVHSYRSVVGGGVYFQWISQSVTFGTSPMPPPPN